MLHRFWGLRSPALKPLSGGMSSKTWLVEDGGLRFVAKKVLPTQIAELLAGCEVAAALADDGIITGRPVPTIDGRLTVREHGLALLEHVPGRELRGETDQEQRWMGATLACVHLAGHPGPGGTTATFLPDWLSPQLPGVATHPWLVQAIAVVRAETNPMTLSWSIIHSDPAPEAFVHDEDTGATGLIDWAGARRGPVLYDVASAVMYLGGPREASAFLEAYQGHGPLGPDELDRLDSFRRFRWAVQGAYFAWRPAGNNLVGIEDQLENQNGLDRARRGLEEVTLT
ncbi:phosphotransferase [Terrabacter sp. NPDC000476]|uniref:phosphotransferase enzyme family protein n=1 Tax=Terrabacter sp. NPDC000476 TaxID=3154258 RepID=UPI00331F80B7